MNGYTYDPSQIQLCRNLADTLRGLTPETANAKILSAANGSGGSVYEFERILRQEIHSARVVVNVMAALNDAESECTCLPLDGGLGAKPCQACKRAAGDKQIEF